MTFKNLWKTKSLEDLMEDASSKEHTMKKTLGPLNLTTLGIGAIIGAGIFVLTGNAAAQYAGPGIVVSFIISGLACTFAALCYAEFAAMIPISGSAYTYAYATMGEFLAWLIGWDLIIEYLFAAATVSVGWSGYVTNFLNENLGFNIPAQLTNAPINFVKGTGWEWTGAVINAPAVFIIVLLTVLLVIGIKESARFNNVVVIVKVAIVLLFIFFGISYINQDNWHPFIPSNTGEWGTFGWSGILRGAGVIFFAYIGFDAVSTAAQEAKNPQRDMPIGILSSLVICTLLYILVALVLTGIVDYRLLGVPHPIAIAVDQAGSGLAWLSPIVKLGAIAGLTSVILVMMLGQPRIFYTMAKDGLLPKTFGHLHRKFRTPHISTILTGTFAGIMGGLFPIGILGELVSIGTLLAFTIVCLGVLVLHYKRPELHRPFKTPFMPYIPILGAVFSLIQMFSLPIETWMRLMVWMAIGLVIYFFYSRFHSKIALKSP